MQLSRDMQILRRAIKDTVSHFKAAFTGLAGAVISIVLFYLWEGREMAVDELPFVVTGICGAFGAVFLLFLFNLWQAPARIERDMHEKTKAELKQMRGGQMTCTFLPQPREHLSDDHRYGFRAESQLLYFASLANKTGKHLSNAEIWVSHKRKWLNTPDEFISGSQAVKMGDLGPFAVEEERQVALLGLLRKTVSGTKCSATGSGLFFPRMERILFSRYRLRQKFASRSLRMGLNTGRRLSRFRMAKLFSVNGTMVTRCIASCPRICGSEISMMIRRRS